MLFIPQSTAYTFRLGPFLDSTDGNTRETGLTIAQTDRRLSKVGGAYAQQSTTGTLSHDANGFYTMTLSTTDTDTLGSLELDVNIAGALVLLRKWQVITADSYNALNGSGNGLRANVISLNSLTAAAGRLAISSGLYVPGTVDNTAFTPTATEFECADVTRSGTDHFKGRSVIFSSGTLQEQATRITAYSLVGGRGHFTVTALNATPANGATLLIV